MKQNKKFYLLGHWQFHNPPKCRNPGGMSCFKLPALFLYIANENKSELLPQVFPARDQPQYLDICGRSPDMQNPLPSL